MNSVSAADAALGSGDNSESPRSEKSSGLICHAKMSFDAPPPLAVKLSKQGESVHKKPRA